MTADLLQAAQRFDTPLYVYDFDAIEARLAALRSSIHGRVKLFHAVKMGGIPSPFGVDEEHAAEIIDLILFLGHETPREILIKDGQAVVIRQRKDVTQFN